jgi:flagellin
MGAGVVIGTNVASIHAARVLSKNRTDLETAMARLASGKRLNSAADDAAASSVAAKMKADIRGTEVAVRNINDGISLFQTVDGVASEVESMLIRMRELAVQMVNETYDTSDRVNADKEFGALISEVARISTNSAFNRIKLTDGSATGIRIQSGSVTADNLADTELTLPDLSTTGLAISALAISSAGSAEAAIDSLDTALDDVAGFRAEAGSAINRLGFALSNAQNVSQRLKEALSGLEDTDYAAESAALARGMVLAQAGSAMLAQANQAPQYVLTLLRS